jgi:WD40 repeat protein
MWELKSIEEEKLDADQREKLRALNLRNEYGAINDCVATPDGKYFFTGHENGIVALWDAKTGVLRRGLDAEGIVNRVVISRDGKRIAGGGDIGLIWDVRTGKLVAELEGTDLGSVNNILFFDGDRKVATAHDSGITGIWDAETGQPLHFLKQPRSREGHYYSRVFGLAATPSGSQLVTGEEDGSVVIWDTQTGEMRHSLIGHTARVHRIAMSPSGDWFVTASYDNTARVWNTENGESLRELIGHEGKLRNVEVVGNGRRVITASYDSTIRVWDVYSGQPLLATLDERAGGHTSRVYTFASALDGQTIVSVSDDGTGRVWRSEGGTTFVAVVSSLRSLEFAQETAAQVRVQAREYLKENAVEIQETLLPGKGVFYRVVIEPGNARSDATAMCANLKAVGFQDCFVVPRN